MQRSSYISWAIVVSFFVLLLGLDFSHRISILANSVVSNVEFDKSYIVTGQGGELEPAVELLKLYEDFDKPKPILVANVKLVPTKSPGMSNKEKMSQQGRLEKFFVDDNSYVLTGVFYENVRFAVLLQTNIATKEVREIKILQGETIGGYLVKSIAENRVVFSMQDRHVVLSIF